MEGSFVEPGFDPDYRSENQDFLPQNERQVNDYFGFSKAAVQPKGTPQIPESEVEGFFLVGEGSGTVAKIFRYSVKRDASLRSFREFELWGYESQVFNDILGKGRKGWE